MSQPEAALYIQPPTFETNVAVQITANAVWRNGAANETVSFEFDLSVLTLLPSGKKELTEQSMRDAPFTGRSRRFESAHSNRPNFVAYIRSPWRIFCVGRYDESAQAAPHGTIQSGLLASLPAS